MSRGSAGLPHAAAPVSPVRVLLVENTVRGLGGSYESLFLTATHLDRKRFEPIVLFFQPNHFAQRLEAEGIRVLVEKSRQFWEKESHGRRTGRLRAGLPRAGLLGAARRRAAAFFRLLAGGIPMAWTIHRILARERIGLLHTNNNLQRDAMTILAGLAAGIPVVAHERQLTPCSPLTGFLSRKVRTLICISEAVLEFTRTSGARTRDCRRIYNAIDLDAMKRVKPSLPPGPPRVGIVGRILPKKGHRIFIEAAARVHQAFQAAKFFIIGAANAEDRAYEDELRSLATGLGLDDVLCWTGYLADPLPTIASLDVVVHAAVEPEPFGRVIIESMALGRPLVATALGGPVEIIQDGVSGWLVPAGDAPVIAERVLALLRDQDLARRTGSGALKRAVDFGVEAYIRQIETVYDDALRISGSVP
ncbi:MAG TPA: glycosyltransferase family 4 protein [Planctomycetota bacterium]|nr:glycosyltransferase family 4 protein [Planctomycetota bacterium]